MATPMSRLRRCEYHRCWSRCMACEDSGLTVGLKPGELKMDLLRSDRRAVRSQNIFLNKAPHSVTFVKTATGKIKCARFARANSQSSRSYARVPSFRTTKACGAWREGST